MFLVGSDQPATTIIWAMAEMIKNPRVVKKAQAEVRDIFKKRGKIDEKSIDELKYLKAIIKEVLRMHPSAPLLLPRESGQACEIDGYHIPIKSKLIINAWAIGMDPKYWTEPERFYPERFIDSSLNFKGTNFEYIPFGARRRICPGINFGIANVELTLTLLLCHFDWKRPNGMKKQNFYRIAVCLRDDKGQFVAAFAKRFEGQPAIDEAEEAIGVLEALQWLHTSHNAASLIEIHSLHVAQAIGSNTKNNSEFGAAIEAAEYAKEIMKTHDVIFASRPHTLTSEIIFYESKDIVFSPYGEYWRQLRKFCTVELLSIKRVQSFRPIREQEINNLVKNIASEEGRVVNLSQQVVSMMFSITSRAVFGKKYIEQDEFISEVREVMQLSSGFYIGDLFPSAKWLQNFTGMRSKLEKVHRNIDRILEIIIDDHKETKSETKDCGLLVEGEEDLIDVLLKFEEGSSCHQELSLTKRNIKAILFDIFSGGSDTAATTINWTMAEMMKDQRVLKKAQTEVRMIFEKTGKVDETCIDELKYLKAIVKEVLRIHPPAPLLIPRECGQACEIDGYHIPVKSKVIINAWAIGMDPKYWTEPERFYPERFIDCSIDYKGNNFEYIPFGAGRRMCPGINYGMANVELTLALLLCHFDWKLPNGMKCDDLDMTELFGASVIRKDDLNLIPITYPSLK
ncbi:cytochrome P450 71D11 [Trifolium repens]|nr:cytochrome P450 71D11 [Trifolium repens]